jgi:hypothetical protein
MTSYLEIAATFMAHEGAFEIRPTANEVLRSEVNKKQSRRFRGFAVKKF